MEQEQGQTTHLNDARWFDYSVVQGGPNAFYQRMTNPYTFIDTILYYLLYDPSATPASATDPRPGFPTMFVARPPGPHARRLPLPRYLQTQPPHHRRSPLPPHDRQVPRRLAQPPHHGRGASHRHPGIAGGKGGETGR